MHVDLLFPSALARDNHPEHLSSARLVLAEQLARVQPNAWNVCQSESMFDDRLESLLSLIAKEAFMMLSEQGFDMAGLMTNVTEFWGQEFLKHGQHMEHVHSNGAQVTGFYFVDVPKESSIPVVFDPRHGKRQINLPQVDMNKVTYSSEQMHIAVQSGDLLMFNSWLPHGFTRHESDEPLRFIHFNVGVAPSVICQATVI